jgi:hypothetical protein
MINAVYNVKVTSQTIGNIMRNAGYKRCVKKTF